MARQPRQQHPTSCSHLFHPALSVTLPPVLAPAVLARNADAPDTSAPVSQALQDSSCDSKILLTLPKVPPPMFSRKQLKHAIHAGRMPRTMEEWCRAIFSFLCGILSIASLAGLLNCTGWLLVFEFAPGAGQCRTRHPACYEQKGKADPGLQRMLLIGMVASITCLPIATMFWYGYCICLNCRSVQRGQLDMWVKRMVSRLADCKERLYRLLGQRCRTTKTSPSEFLTLGGRQVGAVFDSVVANACSWNLAVEQQGHERRNILDTVLQRGVDVRPRHWNHADDLSMDFMELVELDPLTGEGAAVAQLVLKDPTWHCPPHVLRVVRIEHGQAWHSYSERKRQLRASMAWRGFEMPLQCKPPLATVQLLPPEVKQDLDASVNEQMLLVGTTHEHAWVAAQNGQAPLILDSIHRDILFGLGGGALFCESGFMAHEQAADAGYAKAGSGIHWAALACRVLVGRTIGLSSRAIGTRLHRDWESGSYGSIVFHGELSSRREFLLPKEAVSGAYPEYLLIFK
eukprot:TRINITY_DN14718_c0_g1_i1.p1 TRINITY_DN14718_c0_g1~~TRINITY_DN14718_c0_g1_i1.p1  ORF type:complete len:515 (+),score=61.32 TRINITY_DN14718_c0_g1_i1:123-1667(+)